MYAEFAKIYSKNESSIHEIVKKEKEIQASFTIIPQNAKITSPAHHKPLGRCKEH